MLWVVLDGKHEDIVACKGWRHVVCEVLAVGCWNCCGKREFDVILGLGFKTTVHCSTQFSIELRCGLAQCGHFCMPLLLLPLSCQIYSELPT